MNFNPLQNVEVATTRLRMTNIGDSTNSGDGVRGVTSYVFERRGSTELVRLAVALHFFFALCLIWYIAQRKRGRIIPTLTRTVKTRSA